MIFHLWQLLVVFFIMTLVVRTLFWIWLLVMLILNLIPLGNETNQSLSGSKLFEFRLDYLLHAATFLCFAWIWVLGKLKRVIWFQHHEKIKYAAIVICCAVGFELLHILIPWRSFNPFDMVYNLFGPIIVVSLFL